MEMAVANLSKIVFFVALATGIALVCGAGSSHAQDGRSVSVGTFQVVGGAGLVAQTGDIGVVRETRDQAISEDDVGNAPEANTIETTDSDRGDVGSAKDAPETGNEGDVGKAQ